MLRPPPIAKRGKYTPANEKRRWVPEREQKGAATELHVQKLI